MQFRRQHHDTPGWLCIGSFSCGAYLKCSTRICSFSKSTFTMAGRTLTGSCARASPNPRKAVNTATFRGVICCSSVASQHNRRFVSAQYRAD